MAKRGGEAALKRAREKARLEKQELKREKRLARAEDETEPVVDTQALMEEFAQLSSRYEARQVSHSDFIAERHRIFVALGLESEDATT